jgi:MFS family permease
LLESAPIEQRGFYCALQYGGQGLAAVLAGLVGYSIASSLDAASLDAYGWRIAMALGASILPVGLVLRWSAPETLKRRELDHKPAKINGFGKDTQRTFLIAVAIIGASAAGSQVFRYFTTYCITFLHLPTNLSLAVPAVSGAFVMTFGVFGGAISDRVGRRPVMIPAEIAVVLITFPLFYLIVHVSSIWVLFCSVALLSTFSAMGAGATIVALTESLPMHVRSTTFALAYAVAQAVFGGTTQPFVTWLIHETGNPVMLGWYALFAAAVGLVAKLCLAESAPCIGTTWRRLATSSSQTQ